jgi:hypothetical protein
MSRLEKVLLALCVCFLAAAAYLSRIEMDEKTTTLIGALELAISVAAGVAIGLAGRFKENKQKE